MFKLKKKQRREVRRITEYMISGGAFFWSGYLTFFIFDKPLGQSLLVSTTAGYLIGWTVNYILQRYWVFNNPKLAKHQTEVTGRYIVISVVNIPINYLIIESLDRVGITPYIGQFVSSGFFTVWNYLWYKYWVFPTKFPRKRRSAARRSRSHQQRTRAAAVSKPAVLTQRIEYTPRSALRFFRASAPSRENLGQYEKKRKKAWASKK